MNDEVRQAVADAHGLPQEAVSFLSGSTVAEVEESADRLAKLLGAHAHDRHEQETTTPAPDPISLAFAATARRKREVAALFSSEPPRARDELGRFTKKTTSGFDGGARGGVPQRRSPEAAHNELVAQLAVTSKAFGGGGSF